MKALPLGGVKDHYDCLLSYMHSNTQLSEHWVNPFHFLLRKYSGLIENKTRFRGHILTGLHSEYLSLSQLCESLESQLKESPGAKKKKVSFSVTSNN